MSNQTLSIDDRLYAYLSAVTVQESELLQQLREETRTVEFSTIQISAEQGLKLLRKKKGGDGD